MPKSTTTESISIRWGARRAITMAVAAATVITAVGVATPASAAPGSGSTAWGQFLSGDLLSSVDAGILAQLGGARATSNGTQTVVDSDDLQATLLSSLGIEVGGGVQLPISAVDLGVLGEYAEAGADGAAVGASGAVADDGSIGLGPVGPDGPPTAFTFSLSDLIGPAFTGTISDADLELGAVSASAVTDGAAPPVGDYQIAGARLSLDSPTVAGLSGVIRTTVAGAVDPVVAGLAGPTGLIASTLGGASGLAPDAARTTVSVNVDLAGALDPLIGPTAPALGAGGPIEVDLGSGQVTVDIRELLAANGRDLNNLGVGEEILSPAVLSLITAGVTALFSTLVDDVVVAVGAALRSATVTAAVTLRLGALDVLSVSIPNQTVASIVGGTATVTPTLLGGATCFPVPLPIVCGGSLNVVLRTAVAGILNTTLLNPTLTTTLAANLRSTVTDPALALLRPALANVVTQIVSLRANVQETAPAQPGQRSFTQAALRLTVLGSTGPSGALSLDIAQAAVGAADAVAPRITGLTPVRGPQSGGTPVTITGTGFLGATAVTFDGIPATDLVVASDTSITVTTPANAPGPVPVVIQHPNGSSLPGTFTYYPVTAITAVAPSSGPVAGGTVVTITGQCFTGATAVTFGGTPAASFTVDSDTRITATTAAGSGLVDVAVVAPGDCGTGTADDAFAFVAPGAPVIQSIVPDRGTQLGGTPVVITGTGFTGATAVSFGGTAAASFTVTSPTTISAITPAHAPGLVDVIVTAPPGASAPGDFTFFPVTDITGVTPGDGPETGGDTVTITGQCFSGATQVLFGSTSATSFTVVSDTEITAVAPAGTGTVSITVVGAGECGSGTIPAAYEYLPTPSVSGIAPPRGPETGGSVVTITGVGFDQAPGREATGVTFDGIPGTAFTVVSDTELRVTSPAHLPGPVGLIVQSTLGGSVPVTFTYFPITRIDAVAPGSGAEAGGETVTITGQCFTGATSVLFGTTPAASFSIDSDTRITAVTPAGAGLVDVTVTSAGECGSATLDDAFAFVAPTAPVVTSLVPARGSELGGTSVVITGTRFTGATSVTFDGIAGTAFSVDSDTQITVTSPAHDPELVDVVVVDPDGSSAPVDFTYFPVTAVDSVSPDDGLADGGTIVTITGQCFTGATGVLFGSTPATDFVVTSDTVIVATAPAGVGTVGITVTGVGECGTGTLPAAFDYLPEPAIAGVTPDEGPVIGGTVVTISGTDFTGATGVTFDGVPGTAFTVDSSTQITVTSPAHPAGVVDLVITSPNGTSDPVDFTYNPVPVTASLAPTSGPEVGGTVVTLTGTGFLGATGVTFDGTPGTAFTVDSDTVIRVTSPAHAPGTVDVVVLHPNGDSAPVDFTYLATPTVTAIVPDRGPVAGGTVVTVTGTGFTGATSVTFDGLAGSGIVVVSPTELRVTSPAHPVGVVDLIVTTPGGVSDAADYTYFAPATITSLAPTSGPEVGGTVVTITGSGFLGATGVTFDGTVGTGFTVLSDTSIRVVSPAHAPGTAAVVVQHPDGASAPVDFGYLATPTVTGIVPGSGPIAGGTVVTLTGTGFTGATSVTFDGIPGTAIVVDSPTQVRVTSPAHPAGVVDVIVTAPGGVSAPADFAFVAVPTVSGITPDNGPIAGGTVVTVTGTGLTGATGVTFDGLAGTGLVVVSPTELRITAPAHPFGVVDLVVSTPGGLSDPFDYTYIAQPVVSSLAPDSGPEIGGTVVTITGSGFLGATGVTFDGTPGTTFSVVSDTTITVTTPAGAPATVDVIVQHPSLDSAPVDFTYVATPTVSGISPERGPVAGGTVVTVTGTGFTGATAVTFDGIAGTGLVVDSPTQLRITSPAHAVGVVDLVVTTPGGVSDATDFEYFAQPAVTSLSPTSGPEAGGTVVTLTGSGLLGATGVTFDGIQGAAFTVDSDTVIRVTSPTHAPGAVPVVVQHPNGTSGPVDFTYLAVGTPVISSVDPASGPDAGGTVVIIRGSDFGLVTGVTFGGVAATSFDIVSPGIIRAVAPAHVAGVVDLVVETPSLSSPPVDFTYVLTPAIGGIDPVTGPGVGGVTVSITGRCFTGATAVFFGSTPAASFTVVNDGLIRAVTPAGSGSVDVTVTGACGTAVGAGDFAFAPVSGSGSPVLAMTGGEGVADALALTLGLILVGGYLLMLRRRETHRRETRRR